MRAGECELVNYCCIVQSTHRLDVRPVCGLQWKDFIDFLCFGCLCDGRFSRLLICLGQRLCAGSSKGFAQHGADDIHLAGVCRQVLQGGTEGVWAETGGVG